MFRQPKCSSNQSPSKRLIVLNQKSQGLCKYPHRKCNFLCLENYDFCLKHILEDKSAPYKPCPFIYTVNGKKCGKPAYRPDRKDTWFCGEHSRKTHFLRQKSSSRHAPPQTQEALLASLSHYAPIDQESSSTREENESEDSLTKKCSQAINPFVEVDAAQVNARCSQVLDYASDSDSDVEVALLDSVWRAQDHESSDAESVDSQGEDPLKHAGVYTAEEVTIIMKDKMIRLQSLYIDQFRRLHHLLKERRRKHLHTLKKEKETLSSIHDQDKTTAKEQKLYQKLKALNHYHKYYGEEAVLHKKALERRAQVTEGVLSRTSHKGKCAFTEGGVKCGAKTLPVTKYCQKHILEDNQQVLFRACGFRRDDHTCKEPTLNVFENATCVYHITLPVQPHNSLDISQSKEESINEKEISQTTNDESEGKKTLRIAQPPELPGEHDTLKSENKLSLLKQSEAVNSTFELPESDNSILKTEPVIPVEETSVIEDIKMTTSTDVKEECPEEKMELDLINEKTANEALPLKDQSSSEDLVMVDMITDVGVVEEVLESEVKPEPVGSIEPHTVNDNNLEN